MYFAYYSLAKQPDPILTRTPTTLAFYIWATFVSFQPIFEYKIKTLNRKAGTRRLKFKLFIARARLISKNIVKRWLISYLNCILFKKIWKKILFIYVSLVEDRAGTPIYLNYDNAARQALLLPALWRKRNRRIKKRIQYLW